MVGVLSNRLASLLEITDQIAEDLTKELLTFTGPAQQHVSAAAPKTPEITSQLGAEAVRAAFKRVFNSEAKLDEKQLAELLEILQKMRVSSVDDLVNVLSTTQGAISATEEEFKGVELNAFGHIKFAALTFGDKEAGLAGVRGVLNRRFETRYATGTELSVLTWLSTMTRRGIMRFLLTSAGIKNPSIHNALVDLLGKPIAESSALCIPTAAYAIPDGAFHAWRFISGREARTPMCELGWKSLGVLELTALPSIDKERWIPMLQETDVLLVEGGDPLYLCYWMQQSGLADLLPSLRETVYVGLSAGSIVMAPNIGKDFVGWKPPTGGDRTLGLVDFAMFPHLDHPSMPDNSLANAEKWAAGMPVPAYLIDDQTAIKVVDGTVEVVSEGHWKLFAS